MNKIRALMVCFGLSVMAAFAQDIQNEDDKAYII